MPSAKKSDYSINIVQKTFSPIISLVLLLKPHVIKSVIFFYVITVIKFLPFLILTSNFALEKSNTIATDITFYFRSISIYSIIQHGMSTTHYSIICFSIGAFELLYFLLLAYYYIQIKKRKHLNSIRINIVVIIIFHVNLIFAQVFCEFLAFKLHGIFFGAKFPIKSSVSVAFQGIVCAVNIIVIIFINGSNYIIFLTVNTPFYQDSIPVKVKMSIQRFIFCVIVENLIIIESFELFLEGNSLKIYKITTSAIIILSFTLMFFSLLNKYNFKTPVNNLMGFLSAYSVISLLIEIVLYLTSFYSESLELRERTYHTYLKIAFVFFWKIVIAKLFLSFTYSISDNILISHLKQNLFKIYDTKVDADIIDDFYFLFDQLIYLLKTSESSNEDIKDHKLVDMILDHKKECQMEDCKCKIIQLIPDNSLKKAEFIKNLVSRIGYLFESTFVQLDYSVDFNLAMLIAEYFSLFKGNNIMAYSIVQTCLHTNIKKLEMFEIILFYSLTHKYVTKLNKEMDKEHVDFINSYYSHYKNITYMNKLMLTFTDGYEKLISCKENFESTLKIVYESESKEIAFIQSAFLTSEHLNLILGILNKLKDTYGKIINQSILNLKNKMPFEYSIKIFLFFYMYNCKKIPKNINRLFEKKVNYLSELSMVPPSAIDNLLNYYYSSRSYSHNIIIKCHKGFKIELFNEKLATELGYDHSSLIGEDMAVMFPHHLRECHTKAMVNYFITNHNLKMKAKKYSFTSNGQFVPIELLASSIPGLEKDYLIICNVNLLNKRNKYGIMLTPLYEIISLSNNFDVNYSLSLRIIKKFNINLLELFEIQTQSFGKLFEKDLSKIEAVKREFALNPIEMFAELLFQNTNMINDIESCRKFEVFDLQSNEKTEKKITRRKSQLDIENFISNQFVKKKNRVNKVNLKRSKVLVVQNILKLITMFNEFEVYDEEYKKLNEALCKFKNSLNGIILDSNGNVNANPNAINNVQETIVKKNPKQYKKECNPGYYIIKIKLRLIYDTAIYLISLTEKQSNTYKTGSIIIDNQLNQNRLNLSTSNSSTHSSLFNKNQSVSINKTNHKLTAHHRNRNSNSNNSCHNQLPSTKNNTKHLINNDNETPSFHQETNQKAFYSLNSSSPIIRKDNTYSKSAKMEISNIKRKNNKTILSLIISLFISIGISIILFILQHYILEKSHSLFLVFYALHHQKDKLLNLASASLTLLYKHCDITAMVYQLEDYIALVHNNTIIYKESYHNFYKAINYYSSLTSDTNYTKILINLSFSKIQSNWEKITYVSDYTSESYYLSFQALQSVQYESELTDKLKEDIDLFIFDAYLKDTKKEVNSFLPVLLYFLIYNYDTTIINYFTLIESNIKETFANSTSSFSAIYLIVEFLNLANYFLVFGLAFYYLFFNNRLIFRNILKMFLNPYQAEKSSFQNQYENFALKQTVGSFSKMLRNFQKDVIRDFLNKYHRLKKKNYCKFNINTNTNPSIMNIAHNTDENNELTNYQMIPNLINDSSFSKPKIQTASNQGLVVKQRSLALMKSNSNSNNTNNNTGNNNKSAQTQSSFYKLKDNTSTVNTTMNDNDYDYDINSSNILSKTKTVGFKVIKLLYICLVILFLIMLLLFITKIINSLQFLNNIDILFSNFSIISLHYSNVFLYFNTIRIIFISPSKGNIELMKSALTIIDESRAKIDRLTSSGMNEFQKTSKYYSMLLLDNSDPDFKPETICNGNTWCIDQITQKNNVLTQGINIGIHVMMLSFVNIFNDFIKLNKTFTSVQDVTSLIIVSEFTSIENAISFGVNKIQETLYSLFYLDSMKIKENYLLKVNLFNAGSLVYSLIVFAIVLFVVILNIRCKSQTILYGAYKFNRSLYYSFGSESEEM